MVSPMILCCRAVRNSTIVRVVRDKVSKDRIRSFDVVYFDQGISGKSYIVTRGSTYQCSENL